MSYKTILKQCNTCKKEKPIGKNAKFCSRNCYFNSRGRLEIRNCRSCSNKFGVYLSAIRKGWGKGIYCSQKCYRIAPKSQEFKDKISKAFRGENHPNWKGGIMKGRKDRNLIEYKNWRKEVFGRDKYTCQMCGIKNRKGLGFSIRLEADHIIPYAISFTGRYDINNGRTLCTKCHYKVKKETNDMIFFHKAEYLYDQRI